MSTDTRHSPEGLGPAATDLDGRPGRERGRLMRLLAGLSLLLVAAAVAVAIAHPFASGGTKPGVQGNGSPTSLTVVREGSLASQTAVNGTLGYEGDYSIVNNAAGAATWLPGAGQVIRRGQVIYRVDGEPVVLLYGSTPAYRTLKEGMTGADVRRLNANLVALGYASSAALDPASDYFGWETKYALELLLKALGVKQTGALKLGQAVFLPDALRITHVMTTLGTAVAPGGVVMQASAIRRHVTVNLDAAQRSSVKVGDRVTITLPDGKSTPGTVTGIGKVANSGGSGSSTVSVYIALRHPRDAGGLDQAPVEVAITTARVRDALIVPINSLLALAGGGYAVETVDTHGFHHLVPVSAGLFDDADGLVQVSGALAPGEKVVVPST
jgi:peptidoglycan hydrolase-like protein with peptidoglycan-binding domain